jgi:hypothetical protein
VAAAADQASLVERQFTQTSHGLAVGTPVSRNTSGLWVPANRTDEDLAASGIVSEVVDANTLKVTSRGYVELTTGQWDAITGGSGGLQAGRYYWLHSTAGTLTTTKPTAGAAQVVLEGITSTVALVVIGESLEVGDGIVTARTADDATINVTADDRYVYADTTGGSAVVNLPAAVQGMIFTIKVIGANTATVTPASGNSIDRVTDATVALPDDGSDVVTLQARANGAWEVV